MKEMIKNWWNKPWTNGGYVMLCVKIFVIYFAILALFLMKIYGWFDKIKAFFRKFKRKNNYYEQGGEN